MTLHTEALARGRDEYLAKVASGEIVKGAPEFNPVRKWESSPKTSKALAIEAMCAHCMGCTKHHLEPGFRKAVAECSAPHCPLHAVRPYK